MPKGGLRIPQRLTRLALTLRWLFPAPLPKPKPSLEDCREKLFMFLLTGTRSTPTAQMSFIKSPRTGPLGETQSILILQTLIILTLLYGWKEPTFMSPG